MSKIPKIPVQIDRGNDCFEITDPTNFIINPPDLKGEMSGKHAKFP